MISIIEQALKGTITPDMEEVALKEKCEAGYVREMIA